MNFPENYDLYAIIQPFYRQEACPRQGIITQRISRKIVMAMVYRFLAMGVLSYVTMFTATPQRCYGQAVNSEVALTGALQTVKPGPRIDVSKSSVSGNVPNQSILNDASYKVPPQSAGKGGRVIGKKQINKMGKKAQPQFYPPALDKSGNAYFASCSGKITAIDPSGNTKWLMQLPGRISTGFTIGQNNTLYFSSDDTLYAVDNNGRLKWTFKTDNTISFPAIVDKQENIYIVTAKDNMLYAVRPEGRLNWKVHIDGDVAMQPSITAEGSIYVAVQDKSLYVLNPDGKFHWRRRIFSKPPEKPIPSPSTGNDVALNATPETTTKPVAVSQGQPIPEALRISRKKLEIEETSLQQPHESATTAFTASTQKGYAPLRVEFLDTSTGDVIDRCWDFGDGTLVNSDRTPAHTYIIPGNYNIRFITKRTDMVSTIVKKQYITVMDASMSNNRGEAESVSQAENKGMPPVPTQISTVNGIPISKSGDYESAFSVENKERPSAPAQITTASEGRKPIKYFPQKAQK